MTVETTAVSREVSRVLVVDDEPTMLRYISALLMGKDYELETAANGLEAMEKVRSGFAPDLVLMDLVMPEQDGITTLRQLREAKPALPVIMLSCVSDTRRVVEAMRFGARDYITKPFAPEDLESVVEECLRSRIPATAAIADEVDDDLWFLAASPAMRKLRERVELVARVDIPVLVTGESGTGKEVLVRLIHKLSARSNRNLLKVNCAAMPGELLESELFGYEPGAFTGAVASKPGKFEVCDRGTILLDEIGELPPMFQAKLLQVLQDHTFSRLGSRKVVKVDVRVFAATNIDIKESLANKQLREDLYYRLAGMHLHIPPLRERKEEIGLLLKHYSTRYAEQYACPPLNVTARLLEACMAHPWPGNVRELCNFVKRALVLHNEAAILSELHEHALQYHDAGSGQPLARTKKTKT